MDQLSVLPVYARKFAFDRFRLLQRGCRCKMRLYPCLVLSIIGFVLLGQSPLPPPTYNYVVVTYSCRQQKNIVVFSQVFGACYQETNHAKIASAQRQIFTSAAAAACVAGLPVFEGQRSGFPYEGRNAQDKADADRSKDVRESIGYGYRVESVHVQEPYYTKCGR